MRSTIPRLSFGVPVRNGGPFIRRLLESLEAQELREIEVVVCDNQSNDETSEIVQEFARRDHRFRYYLNEVDIGQIKNFNRVFELSRAPYFRWIGADDWVVPAYGRKCVAALDANPDAVGVTTLWRYVDDDGHEWVDDYTGRRVESTSALGRMSRMLWLLQSNLGADPIYSTLRSDVLRNSGLLAVSPWTDRMLALELAIAGPFCHVHECLAVRRNAREPAKVRLARYHNSIREVERATEVRLAPRWTLYRDLTKVAAAPQQSIAVRSLGSILVVGSGGLHYARVLPRYVSRLMSQRRRVTT